MSKIIIDKPIRGELHENISLSDYTSWRVGGPATYLYRPADAHDLADFLTQVPERLPIIWIGLGSNLLVRDCGVAAVVIATQGRLTGFDKVTDNIVRIEAGVACAKAARGCARNSLTGVEFLAGVPGTIGGALAMNAGCFGGETWNHVIKVETVNRKGEIIERTPDEFEIAYRSVVKPADEWFLAGYFQLSPGDKDKSLQQIRELLDRRASTQPTGEPSCGSVFRNPPGDHSARLIEACGLKNYAIGGARVSPKHANFIVNDGNASAADIEQLINHVRQEVEAAHGVCLIPEVHIIGD